MRAEAGVRPVRRGRPARVSRTRTARRAARVAAWALGAALLLLLAGGLVFAGSAGSIAAGITVAGVNVGGLSEEEAQARLKATARRYASVPVVFTADGERFTLRPAALDVRGDWNAAAAEALDEGDASWPLRGLRRLWLRVSGAEVEPAVNVYEPALDYRLGQLAAAVDRPAREASLILRGREPEIVGGRSGRRLDREAAAGIVVAALGGFEREETALPVAVDEPQVTRETLRPVAARVRTILSAPVRLTYSGVSFVVRPRELARLLVLPSGGATDVRIDEAAAARRFANLARGVARAPRNADFAVRPNGTVRVVPSRPGRELDVAATADSLLAAASRTSNRTSELVVTEAQPALTTREARALGVRRELAGYATLYSGTADRITNLQRGIELLDGARIAPGAVWSFNEQIGPRTEERGFRSAPVIINGEYEEDVGGGVSQIATTVFNSAWESGIKIAERTAHALYISRYPTGRDATVNYPDVDLKLRNDTPRWIVIKASYDESGILVRLLGGGPERRVESVEGPLEVTGQPRTQRIPDPSMFVGQRLVVDYGEPSRAVTVERIVYQGGEVLYDETWTTSYRYEKKIVRVGTKPEPVAPPPEQKPPEEEKPQPPPGGGGGGGGGGGAGGGGGGGGRA